MKNNQFNSFCKRFNYNVPDTWPDTKILKIEEKKELNQIDIYLKIEIVPQINDFIELKKTFKQIKHINLYFDIEFQFLNKKYLQEYLFYIYKKMKLFNEEFDWSLIDISFNNNQEYVINTHNDAVLNNLQNNAEKILIEFEKFGINNIKFLYYLDHIKQEQIQKIEEDKQKQIDETFELQSQIYNDSNENDTYKYKSNYKRSYIAMDIAECNNPNNYEKFVSIEGEIFKINKIITRSKAEIFQFYITDYKDAILVKVFCNSKDQIDIFNGYQIDDSVMVEGELVDDSYAKARVINLKKITKIKSISELKIDDAKVKRVELSTRSLMTPFDGIVSAEEYVKYAKKIGHRSLAILDLESVQAFPLFESAAKKNGIKPIYGATFSAIEKNVNIIDYPSDDNLIQQKYIVFDLETTGLSPSFNEIIEFGAVVLENSVITERYQFFIKPENKIPDFITEHTKITNEMVADAISQKEGIEKIRNILKNFKYGIAHNASFDFDFINEKIFQFGLEKINLIKIDTMQVSRVLTPEKRSHTLQNMAYRWFVNYDNNVSHRADYDAEVLSQVWIKILYHLTKSEINTFNDLNNLKSNNALLTHQWPYEISIIAKNKDGLKDLFKLISVSATDNFINGPKLFFDELSKKENLMYGSSTLKSRIFRKLFYETTEKLIQEISFYDYIEIPAMQDLIFFTNEGFSKNIIQEGVKKLIKEAKKLNKIVVAVSDARYIKKEQKQMLEVYINSKLLNGKSHYLKSYRNENPIYPTQNFLTTQEMIEQFQFLIDEKLIKEIVVTNTNKIADMIDDNIQIIKDKLYVPKFDNSHEKLQKMVYENAHKIYGDILPNIVRERIEKELNPILEYGFDVTYWFAYILVKKSVEDGYLVGSRGSVGSSIVATLIGITEVNPLVPHYICKKCKYSDFDHPEVLSGYDLPEKKCPKCNNELDREGHNIPFETFLGFNADKVPDIDLNFSGEYQSVIHQEVKNLFGDRHSFRAGTITTVADKTAYGYVKEYNEKFNKGFSEVFMSFLASGITGVKKTSGQHPGGIIIIPKEFEAEDFFPINYPANNEGSSWKTAHFDYKSVHDNLLKLDLLGHDYPTTMKKLEEITGVLVEDIPKNDPSIIKLFSSTEPLNIKPADISGETTGALGLPEFGTMFVRKMLKQATVNSFADLVAICGLSHGTNVWSNNADKLISENKIELKNVISCRDDIMTYLISEGVDSLEAFNIMEKVRKGILISEEQERLLETHKIPGWYIDSMKKIEYLFPKAHATAYSIMSWRTAYYKLYYPLEFYATYFSIKADHFDLETFIAGKQTITNKIKELKNKKNDRKEKISVKEESLIGILSIAEEMYARGYKIQEIDLYKSSVKEWIVDKKNKSLIPPFVTIEGLGETVAQYIKDAAISQPFLSIEDFQNRTKINKTLLEKIINLGILKHLNKTNQISLF